MKFFAAVLLCSIVAVSCDSCLESTTKSCSASTAGKPCTSFYGSAREAIPKLNDYLNEQIAHSFQYLLMSSHFGTYKQSREGFEKLYRKLSDESWEDAIDLIKYITLRGGSAKLEPCLHKSPPISSKPEKSTLPPDSVSWVDGCTSKLEGGSWFDEDIQVTEVQSLSLAVDIQKKLADRSHRIYHFINKHDPEVGSYIEDKFMHRYAKTIRNLVGFSNDLKKLVTVGKSESSGLQRYIMDEYLQKIL